MGLETLFRRFTRQDRDTNSPEASSQTIYRSKYVERYEKEMLMRERTRELVEQAARERRGLPTESFTAEPTAVESSKPIDPETREKMIKYFREHYINRQEPDEGRMRASWNKQVNRNR